ncbi:MAG: Uma2 family endonuclease [Anaerolineales bacterium]|nr:Uma2 family endonuclease [Anaerolineales bacterium]
MLEATLTPTQDWPAPGQWTYDDYLRLPDDGQRYEIIEGVLYVANAPSSIHQFTVGEIFAAVRDFVKKHNLGQVVVAPFEVHLSETTRPVQPDVFFVKAERWPAGEIQFFAGPPDLIVEVLSPGSIRLDRYVKFQAYEQAGVPEYWIANPHLRVVEVYTLSGGEYALLGEFSGDEIIKSVVLEGLPIINHTLFVP